MVDRDLSSLWEWNDGGATLNAIDLFLAATDLDDLLRKSHNLDASLPEVVSRVQTVLSSWSDEQAVANLLFHPAVIPPGLRHAAVDRGLKSADSPYLQLAAVVGLQSIDPEDVPTTYRNSWRDILTSILRDGSGTTAERASVTMFGWFPRTEAARILSLYPATSDAVSRNIRAFAISVYGDSTPAEFVQHLSDAGIAKCDQRTLAELRAEYKKLLGNDASFAQIMKCPALCYIPNLSDRPVEGPVERPWWKV